MIRCCTGWWRLICLADDLQHKMVRGRVLWSWLCDTHDRHITGGAA